MRRETRDKRVGGDQTAPSLPGEGAEEGEETLLRRDFVRCWRACVAVGCLGQEEGPSAVCRSRFCPSTGRSCGPRGTSRTR